MHPGRTKLGFGLAINQAQKNTYTWCSFPCSVIFEWLAILKGERPTVQANVARSSFDTLIITILCWRLRESQVLYFISAICETSKTITFYNYFGTQFTVYCRMFWIYWRFMIRWLKRRVRSGRLTLERGTMKLLLPAGNEVNLDLNSNIRR